MLPLLREVVVLLPLPTEPLREVVVVLLPPREVLDCVEPPPDERPPVVVEGTLVLRPSLVTVPRPLLGFELPREEPVFTLP